MSLESIADLYGLDKQPVSLVKEPAPVNPVIDMEQYSEMDNRIHEAILNTYNPLDDFSRLKAFPDAFKKLRNEYPLRREYFAYTVINILEDERDVLRDLGFNHE